MTAPAWTPVEAAAQATALAPVQGALEAWREAWAPESPLRLTGWTLRRGRPVLEGVADDRQLARPSIRLRCSRRAAMRLCGLALQVMIDTGALSDADRAVLDRFAERMLADLADRLEAMLGRSAVPLDEGPYVSGAITCDDGDLLTFALPARTLAELRRDALPAPRKGAPPPSRSAALGDTRVTLEVLLGTAKVSMTDLRAIAPGDVLRLDRKLSDTALISMAGGPIVAEASVTEADEHLALLVRRKA